MASSTAASKLSPLVPMSVIFLNTMASTCVGGVVKLS
jgi:hypothetical protein